MFKFFILLFYLAIILADVTFFALQDTFTFTSLSQRSPCTFNQTLINSQCVCNQNFTQKHTNEQNHPEEKEISCDCKDNFEFYPDKNQCLCPGSFTFNTVTGGCECKGGNILWDIQLRQKVCVHNRFWMLFAFGVFLVIIVKTVEFWRHAGKRERGQNFKTLYQRMSGQKESFMPQSTVDSEIELPQWVNSKNKQMPD